MTAKRQQFRERLRLQAAERFSRGEARALIAKDLRVSVRSVQRWRQAWDPQILRDHDGLLTRREPLASLKPDPLTKARR
ncbi:helix-turn-helix domain-containing protein [Streptomyces sp. NPDC057540]|uniref:helix-turn-helix domain-containing protein n=1 Tax=Streptomyces sp. NPDC057540 TaxID=3346160 RepID=UPI0036B7BBAF